MGSDALLDHLVARRNKTTKVPLMRSRPFTAVGTAALILATVLLNTPAFAQVDLSGWWANRNNQDDLYAREQVDMLGIPLNADGRAKALSYNIASLSVTERQCQMYPPFYALSGPFGLQISSQHDPVTLNLLAWNIAAWIDRGETQIWMDGRPHPSPYAPHTHGGFTTGEWQGDTLHVFTTHFKMGDIRRHRAFSSDQATVTYYMTRHDDLLTITGIIEDPVYLAEPYVMTVPYRLSTDANLLQSSACEPIEELPYLHENPSLVPHYLPGENPWVNEVTEKYNIPLDAVMGGAETMYPEFRKKIRDRYRLPPPCTEGCGGP